jgi:hypothetical protein
MEWISGFKRAESIHHRPPSQRNQLIDIRMLCFRKPHTQSFVGMIHVSHVCFGRRNPNFSGTLYALVFYDDIVVLSSSPQTRISGSLFRPLSNTRAVCLCFLANQEYITKVRIIGNWMRLPFPNPGKSNPHNGWQSYLSLMLGTRWITICILPLRRAIRKGGVQRRPSCMFHFIPFPQCFLCQNSAYDFRSFRPSQQ